MEVLVFTEGPPLLPDEIISSHNVGSVVVEIKCHSLCEKEPRCVGFNHRTTATNDENCQLTNVTKKRNTTTKGDWTLRRDMEAVWIFLFIQVSKKIIFKPGLENELDMGSKPDKEMFLITMSLLFIRAYIRTKYIYWKSFSTAIKRMQFAFAQAKDID